tara:strand:- start:51835 stop:52668 length:834 start_codon:yes stop_codon:yes gene_type:complete
MSEELNLKELFANYIKFNNRNRKFIFLIIFIGVVSVICYQKFKKPYYETKAICMSGISEYERQEQVENLSQRTAIDLINHLQINIDNKDFVQLAKVLGVKKDVASTIKFIEAEQLYQQDMDEKYYALNKFEISLTVFDNSKISEIEKGLIYYFENNKFVKSYHNRYIQSNNNIINDVEREIELLDQIRIEGAQNNLDVSSINIVSGKEGKELSNQIVTLSHHREEIKMKQALLKPLVYVQSFANVDKKEDEIFLWSILGTIISYLMSLIIAFVKEII